MEKKIKDLIILPDVRTVVQLSDLSDPEIQEGLKNGFVFTEDVFTNLTIILEQLISKMGIGIFLEGSYGAGKSHFLAIISLLMSQPGTWELFLKREARLIDYYLKIKGKRFLPLNISLVLHASREPLEEIVYTYLNGALSAASGGGTGEGGLFGPGFTRLENFERLLKTLSDQGYDGIVLLIDELSEFLRSKSDSRSFNEDIRFLQFLGEYSLKNPLWIVASLQERIEEIGAINEESFNKIKDRYKIRLLLSAEHIEALIKNRLIIKREGADSDINRLYKTFKGAFPHLEISQNTFYELYPVHPYTLKLLDELKFLFSQRRGIVDFIHYEIRGDSSRKIPGIMENPADSLMGPEYIFDHFLVRLKETTQTRIYCKTVYGYYVREIGTLFPDQDVSGVAMRLIKILLLKAFSPYGKGLSIRELGGVLLCRITSLDSTVNYRFIADIMERLYKEGAYIGCDKGENFFEDVYSINLKEDIQGIIKQKADYIRQGLFCDDERIFSCLSNWVDDKTLPIASLKRKDENKAYIRWQYTTREGFIYIKALEDVSTDELRALYEQFRNGEEDFFLFIDKIGKSGNNKMLQEIAKRSEEIGENLPFIFWIPKYPQDTMDLREGLVYYLLLDKFSKDFTELGRRVYKHLQSSLQERKEKICEIFRQAYFNGEFVYMNRVGIKGVSDIGILPFDRVLNRIICPLLNQLYPLHKDISPLTDYFVRETLSKSIDGFFRQGEIVFEPGMDKGIELLIEGYLKPLKVVKQIPRGYKLNADPETSRVGFLYLGKVKGGRVNLKDLYLFLRKGDYGISRDQFEMLTLAMLFSGQVRGYICGKEVTIQRPDFVNIWCIEEIGEGELVDSRLREGIMECPLIPKNLKKGGFSFITQQRAWDALIEAKRAWIADEERLRHLLRHISGYKSLAHIDMKGVDEDFLSIQALFNEIKVTYTAKNGLERFLSHYRSTPFINERLVRIGRFREFITQGLDIYTNIFFYITDQGLVIPEREEYSSIMCLRDDVKGLLYNQEQLLKEGYIDNLIDSFNKFKEAYTLIYQKEHQRVKAPENFIQYMRIRESPRYQLLSRISGINMISVEDDLVKVNRYLAQVESMTCKGFNPDQLRKRALCTCGFRLGEIIKSMPVKEIEQTIDRGILQYLDALKEPRYSEQILAHAVALEDVGKGRDAASLRRVLDLKITEDGDINQIRKLFTDKLINGLNEAFEGRVVLVERDINELLENIIDRTFPKDKLISIFTEWLNRGKDLNNDVYIKIRYREGGASDYVLSDFVARIFPELIPLMKQTGDEVFQHLLVTSLWGAEHAIPPGEVYKIFALPSAPDDLILDTGPFIEKSRKIYDSLKRHRGEEITHYIEETERYILSKGIDNKLLDLLTMGATEEVLLDKLFHESLFGFIARGLTSILIKRLYSERESGRIEEINRILKEWTERGKTSPDVIDSISERVSTRKYAELLYHFTTVLLALEWFREADLSSLGPKGWEAAFIKHAASFEIITDILINGLQDFSLSDSISLNSLKKEKERFIFALENNFSDFILREYKTLINPEGKGDSGPFFINSIRYHFYERYKGQLNPHQSHFLLIDGMRWDLWEYCKPELMGAMEGRFRVVDQMPLWVFLPSTTSPQMESLFTGEPPSDPNLTQRDINASTIMEQGGHYRPQGGHPQYPSGKINYRFQEIIPQTDDIYTYKYSFIDDKIHSTCEDLLTIYKEVKLDLIPSLKAYLENLPARSMVILFSDHGFVRRKGSIKNRAKGSLYTHGSTSPWEVIVPMVVMYKWM